MSKNLIFSSSTELVRVPVDSVIYISANGNYSTIVTADGTELVLTVQLGQIESKISEMVDVYDRRFVRIGRSLIINREFITLINLSRQKVCLSDCRMFKHELSASRDALKNLKELIEKETMR